MAIIRAKRKLQGINVPHKKKTSSIETLKMPTPRVVIIPMIQNIGSECDVLVKKGQQVKIGEKIGDSENFVSTPIHSSVNGEVENIIDYKTFNGVLTKAVVIKPEHHQMPNYDLKPPNIKNAKDFLKAVRESGAVGLGGAGFPTHVKLSYKDIENVDTLLINGAECEPYITADYRECVETPNDIVEGVKLIQKYLGIKNCLICIEDNKKTALNILDKLTNFDNDISLVELKSRYPQGAEKVLIYSATGRIVKEGQLPADVGVIVLNITTVAHIARYIRTGIPLISKRLTVDGDVVLSPQNLEVLIGTPIREVLEHCQTKMSKIGKVLMGGPMMGVCVYDIEQPIIKNNNGILAFESAKEKQNETTNCIRCARCSKACPINLMPMEIERAFDNNDKNLLENLKVSLCMSCGCCSYVCPAKRDLSYKNQQAKKYLKEH